MAAFTLLSGLVVSAFAAPAWASATTISRIYVTPTQHSPGRLAPAPEMCLLELSNGSRYALELNRGTEFLFDLWMQAKSANKSVLIWNDTPISLSWTGIGSTSQTSAQQLLDAAIQ